MTWVKLLWSWLKVNAVVGILTYAALTPALQTKVCIHWWVVLFVGLPGLIASLIIISLVLEEWFSFSDEDRDIF